ncbi:MAG: tetratricopeptide repeat protein [Sandaracinaceae bacterium]
MSTPPDERSRWLLVAPLLATAVVFVPGLGGAFLWDDIPLIGQNTNVTDPAQLPALLTRPFWDVSSVDGIGRAAYLNLYRPLVSLAYATQWRLFGDEPLGFHLVSLALHLACVALAAGWIRRRLEGTDRARWVAACLGVLPFALHPSRPEVVSWVSGSTDLYWSLFGLFGLQLFERDHRSGTRWLAAACFMLAVLSKETAVVLPLVLLVDGWSRGRRPTWAREGLGSLGTLAGIALHLAVVPPVSVASVAPRSSPMLRVLATLGHFVLRTVWPFDPSVGPAARTLDAAGSYLFAPHAVALGAALVTGLALLVAAAVRRRGRLPQWAGDAALYVLPLLPVSNLIALDGPTLVSDRFLYFSLIGLGAALARAALPAIERGPPRRTAALVVLGGLGLTLGGVCAQHVRHFESAEVLWASERDRDPDSLQALQNSTELALAAGDRDAAVQWMQRTVEVASTRHEHDLSADAGLRLAAVLLQRTPDAEQGRLAAFRELFDGFASSPRLALAQPDLRLDLRVSAEAAEALRRDPGRFGVPRALAHLRTGQLEEAGRQLDRLATEAPNTRGLWTALATTHARRGDWERAGLAAAEGARRQLTAPGFAAQLDATRQMAQSPVLGVERVVRDAEVQNRLGAPEAARRLLDAALQETSGDPALVRARVRADLADGQLDLARAVLERTRAQHPSQNAVWDAMQEELEQAAGPTPHGPP